MGYSGSSRGENLNDDNVWGLLYTNIFIFFFGFRPKEITDWYGERTGGNNTKKKKK